ncbi:hypothetical protein FRACYDRAFT_237063 [Fragilariopsis cylindrus CCMP1102]|uniref:Uncharacterized protein n=1 Tax=Fragilariopsis cylindrus CCMP1102 TaxID=635003 RepID=A0A1E7FLU8_9STRA|nr:hypothetical protein FRACYDRAFT_237063 [Fragilariopsis cylindrus CCMP1102]|eukprot:OEU18783.1 hypothetical protein FRACYDRAFT_237063 [Fragilariopsis cylindrus CCMP1102]
MLDERQKQAEMDCEIAFRKEEHVAISSESDADVTPSMDDNIVKEPKEQQQDDGSSSSNNNNNNNNNFTPIAPKPPITNNNDGPQTLRSGRWTPDEKCLFLYGLRMFGKGRWKKMSCFLPHRSLVQIKSHAQKVLKRQQAGENIFRRLEDNYHEIDNLVVQAARQRDALRLAGIDVNNNNNSTTSKITKITTTKSSSSVAAAAAITCSITGKCTNKQQNEVKSTSAASPKKREQRQCETIQTQTQVQEVQENIISESINNNRSSSNAVDPEYQTSDGSVLAAAVLCQLSSIGGAWMGPRR